MMIHLFTAICIILFIINFKRDQRSLTNAFLFLLSIVMIYLELVFIAYQKFLTIHEILLDVLYKIVPIGIVLLSIAMIINGFVVLKKEGRSLSNSLPILMGIGILLYGILFYLYFGNIFNFRFNYWTLIISTSSFTIISALFAIFMFVFFSLLAYSILYLSLPKKKDYDYIIIHGSGLIEGEKVPPLLAARIDKGIEAYKLAGKKDVKIIASGGQGIDEKISEARAIRQYLLDKGIDEGKIILEDKSTNTYENLKFSKQIAEKEIKNPFYIFISNNYHVFRATIYAKRLNMRGYGVGAKTAGYYIPSAFIREYIAILFKLKKIIFTMIAILIVAMVLSSL